MTMALPTNKVKATLYDCSFDSDKVYSISNRVAHELLADKLTPLEAAFILARLCKMFGGGLYSEDYPSKKTDDDVYSEFAKEPSLDKAMILAGCFIEKTQAALVQTAETGRWPGSEFFLPQKALETFKELVKEFENGK